MLIKVTVSPGAKKERLTKTTRGRYTIEVREPAARNLANERVREIVAKECKVSVGNVRILTGHHSRSKVISIG